MQKLNQKQIQFKSNISIDLYRISFLIGECIRCFS